jgi:hypothetical protein
VIGLTPPTTVIGVNIVVKPASTVWIVMVPLAFTGAMYVKDVALVTCCESGVVTTTAAEPDTPAGVVQVIEVVDVVEVFTHGFPPTVTTVPAVKLDPLTVREVPPVPLPDDGEMAEIVGDGDGVVIGEAAEVEAPAPTRLFAVTLMA